MDRPKISESDTTPLPGDDAEAVDPVLGEELMCLLTPGTVVVVGGGAMEPTGLLSALRSVCCRLLDVTIVFGIHGGRLFAGHSCAGTRVVRFGAFGSDVELVTGSQIQRLAYSRIPDYLGRLSSNLVTMVQVAPLGPGGHSLGLAAEYLPASIEASSAVLAEVNVRAPRTRTDCGVHYAAVARSWMVDRTIPAHTRQGAEETPELARHLGELVPQGATLQLGLGRIIDTAALGLVDHRHLAIRSGIVGDAVMRLQRAGAIRTHVGRPAIRTTMILGSADLYEWAGEGNVLLSRVEDTHDAQFLGGVDDFFAINSALQVGLNGDVNSEVAGGRYTGAVGGLADFAEAATASTGGTSVIVLPSTAKGGRESRIVSPGPEVVSLPHRYVGAVITEFGAARLVGLDTRDRAIALAGIAHPVFRDQLMAAARNSTVA
jgi:acyl-CoA hydrolase